MGTDFPGTPLQGTPKMNISNHPTGVDLGAAGEDADAQHALESLGKADSQVTKGKKCLFSIIKHSFMQYFKCGYF